MAISTLSSNILQGIVTPFAVFQGHKVYNPTSLSEINTIEGLDINGDFMAGQHSNTHLQSCIYQSKYNSDVVWVFDNLFGTPNSFDNQLPNQYRQNESNVIRFKNKKLVDIIHTVESTTVGSVHPCIDFVDEDLNNIYCYDHTSSSIKVYNKTNFKLEKSMSLSIDTCTEDYVTFLKVENGVIYYYVADSDFTSNTNLGRIYSINESTGSISIVVNLTAQEKLYKYTTVRPIIRNNEFFVGGTVGNSSTSPNEFLVYRFDLNNRSFESYKLLSNLGCYTSKTEYNVRGDMFTSSFIINEDSDGNKFLSYLCGNRRSQVQNSFRFYTVSIHSNIEAGSQTVIATTYQNIGEVCHHFIQIDDETILLGNGSSIMKYKWSKEMAKWVQLCDFNVGEYSFFSYENGKIWIRKRNSIIRVLESQGVVLDIAFEKDVYQWTGTNITTFANIRLLNQDSQQTDTVQTIKITGPATFGEGQLTQTITFDKDETIAVPVIITGIGPIEITLEF